MPFSSLLDPVFAFLSPLFPVFFVVGPSLGYIPQYNEIRSGKYEGFSTKVCLILLIANALRIFFWYVFEILMCCVFVVVVVDDDDVVVVFYACV